MSDPRTIAAHLRLAQDCLRDAKTLAPSGSRNAAYLASQAVEHVLRAVATSEGLHIERQHAHQLDSTVRRLPDENSDKPVLARLSFLEAYATTYRYQTPSGRIPPMPNSASVEAALADLETLLAALEAHFGVDPPGDSPAARTAPRRMTVPQ